MEALLFWTSKGSSVSVLVIASFQNLLLRSVVQMYVQTENLQDFCIWMKRVLPLDEDFYL